MKLYLIIILPETNSNIAPENGWLVVSLWEGLFSLAIKQAANVAGNFEGSMKSEGEHQ